MRSFKWLVDAVGAENIALGLDSNLARMTELMNGERFTPETAFHIETTLGLPDGFFDRPDPALTSETLGRLRAPLDFIRANADPEFTDARALDVTAAASANSHATPADRLSRESENPKKTGGGSPRAVARNNPAQAKTATVPSSKPASAKGKVSMKPGAQQSLSLNDVTALQNVRRANLHVLTSRKGSKVRLSAVMSISASNLDNRLVGQKRMDDAEAIGCVFYQVVRTRQALVEQLRQGGLGRRSMARCYSHRSIHSIDDAQSKMIRYRAVWCRVPAKLYRSKPSVSLILRQIPSCDTARRLPEQQVSHQKR